MVLFLRKGSVLICFLLALSLFAAIVLRPRHSVPATAVQPIQESMTPKSVYVLDAGHGGADGGAVSLSGAYESEINLAITLRTREMLMLLGEKTVLTRTGNGSLADDPSASLREQKVSDTKNRVALINDTEFAKVISIHQNALVGHASVHGAQVFYSATQESDHMAETVQQMLNRVVNVGNEKNKKPISSEVYLMNNVICPAILVECGFMSNQEESAQLQNPKYQTLLAMTIAAAAVQP